MPLRLLISDLDGTILETEDYHRRAYNALFKELGLPQQWSRQDYSDRLAQVGGEKFREVLGWLDSPEEEYAAAKKRLYARKTDLYIAQIVADLDAGKLPLRPGVARLFAELQERGIPIAIASTCVKSAAVEVIRAAMGEEFLSSVVAFCAGDDVSRKKPHPEIYLLAAKLCGMTPADCLVLEDTAHGVQAADAAGMVCVATPSELALDDDFRSAHLVAESLDSPSRIDVATLESLMND